MSGVDLTVVAGDRVAIVGQNGAGKSTLLQCIAGHRTTDEGKVVVKGGARLGYLEQKGVSGSKRTVHEEARSQMHKINSARAAVEKAELDMINKPEDLKAVEKLLEAQATFEAVGGLTQDRVVAQILGGLGFSPSDQERPCSEFSGGWQMRIALGKLLLSEPDLLLLDEPTNHLDASAKSWLANYLSMYTGTVVAVSHDEGLLKGAKFTTVAEVANKRVEVFRGCGYSKFLVEREERLSAAKAKYEREQKEIARLQGFVDRFGAQATKASAAQSRVKMIEKMESTAAPPPEVKKARPANIRLPIPPSCHEEQLSLSKASFGWGDGPPTVKGVDLNLQKGQTWAILGPNGAGKSTLLKALAGSLPLSEGERKEGEGLQIGVFTQDLAQDLPQDAVALELVLERVREYDIGVSDEQTRATLGGLGLTGPKALRKIGVLSGGEKARVALAIFVMIPYNMLMLDEPSNHLDVETLYSLVDAIKGWKGTVVVVSHNKEFVTKLCPSHTAVVKDGSLTSFDRPPKHTDWDLGDRNISGEGDATGNASKSVEKKVMSKKERAEAEKERKKKLNAPKRIKKIQVLLEELDAKVVQLSEGMCGEGIDHNQVSQLVKDKEEADARIAKLYKEWEELEALLVEDA